MTLGRPDSGFWYRSRLGLQTPSYSVYDLSAVHWLIGATPFSTPTGPSDFGQNRLWWEHKERGRKRRYWRHELDKAVHAVRVTTVQQSAQLTNPLEVIREVIRLLHLCLCITRHGGNMLVCSWYLRALRHFVEEQYRGISVLEQDLWITNHLRDECDLFNGRSLYPAAFQCPLACLRVHSEDWEDPRLQLEERWLNGKPIFEYQLGEWYQLFFWLAAIAETGVFYPFDPEVFDPDYSALLFESSAFTTEGAVLGVFLQEVATSRPRRFYSLEDRPRSPGSPESRPPSRGPAPPKKSLCVVGPLKKHREAGDCVKIPSRAGVRLPPVSSRCARGYREVRNSVSNPGVRPNAPLIRDLSLSEGRTATPGGLQYMTQLFQFCARTCATSGTPFPVVCRPGLRSGIPVVHGSRPRARLLYLVMRQGLARRPYPHSGVSPPFSTGICVSLDPRHLDPALCWESGSNVSLHVVFVSGCATPGSTGRSVGVWAVSYRLP
ncbi:hypothetical protein B0H16DRAFT_1452156 [Mycena metata]|uniref:Uncharacterized protein n=1 Tax=Mycena metata TaxID=1033252 RepID=A0AAD7JSJ7_9AGAR|nr:hypothetical protein B0H16DRAFT_1452156 [Mycena metata]